MAVTEAGDCLVCQKQQQGAQLWGGIIYEDGLVVVSHAQPWDGEAEKYLGHLFVEPRRHAPGLADLTEQEAGAMGLWISRMAGALRACEGADHVYAFVFGHHVPHLHVHVIPRYPGAPDEYWGVKVDEWPGAPRGGESEVDALADRLRAYLTENFNL